MARDNLQKWTEAIAVADYKNREPIKITVNDRAATRQAIINCIRQSKGEFVERSHWAAHKEKPEGLENDWNYTKIAIHMAGRSAVCGPAALQMQEIQALHQGPKRNWPDVAYHYAIACSGVIYEGRDIRFKGSHLDQFNSGAIGVVILEDLSEPEESKDGIGIALSVMKAIGLKRSAKLSIEQKNGLKVLIEALRNFFIIKELGGHREFPKQKSNDARLCPGVHGMDLVNELRIWSGFSKPSE